VVLRGKSGRVWGAGLRNGKHATNPVFVSIGNKVGLETAVKCVGLCSIHRVPEPVRLADKKSREIIDSIDSHNDGGQYRQYDMVLLDQIK
jgi:deoxyinosine 3'endonuclease (endonuclease V)